MPWSPGAYEAMAISLFEMAQPLNMDDQKKLVDLMAARGHNTTWEAIRYVYIVFHLSFLSSEPTDLWSSVRAQLYISLPVVAVKNEATGPFPPDLLLPKWAC